MNAKDFIIETLKNWEILFPNIIVKYAFEEHTSYHVITVEPNDLYLNDETYNEAESKFWDEFHVKFPEENLLISEPNCCLTMENLLYPEISTETTFNSQTFSICLSMNANEYHIVIDNYTYKDSSLQSSTHRTSNHSDSIAYDPKDNYALAA